MARTTAQAFDEFKANIALTLVQRQVVNDRRGRVHVYLASTFSNASDMPLLRTELIGSAGRGTIVRPPDDIDLMAVFNAARVWSKYKGNSYAFITRVRNALSNYTRVQVVGTRVSRPAFLHAGGPS